MIFDDVTDQMRAIARDGHEPSFIVFSHDGYSKALSENGIDCFNMDRQNTFMGLPYCIDPELKVLVTVKDERFTPPEPPLMNYRVGTPAANHTMSVESLRAFLDLVINIHSGSDQYPEAMIMFPEGFWVTYASRERPIEL